MGRYKIFLDRRDRSFVPHLLIDGYWETWTTEFILRNLEPGQTAYDLGANHGYFTILMADIVGEAGRVLAFEPNPSLQVLLRDSVAVNGFDRRVFVSANAVGDAVGQQMLFRCLARNPKNGVIAKQQPQELSDGEFQYLVQTDTLDAYAQQPAHLIKIDVEGGEASVWRGMQELIAASPGVRILMEFNAHRTDRATETIRSIADRFALREMRLDGCVYRVDVEAVLHRQEDTMLYLSDKDPA